MTADVASSAHRSAPQLAELRMAKALASELIAQIPDDQPFEVQDLLRQHPHLNDFQSVVVDLAYEEYCRAIEAGRHIDPNSFAARFPEYQRSLLRVLRVHDFLDGDQHLLADAEPVWPKLGDTFRGFCLYEELGRGAFSRVFAATEPSVGDRRVVVKACRHGNYEAATLGKLQHPHIVPVYSVQTDEATGLTAICMPLLSRATLFDVLQLSFASGEPPASGLAIVDAIRLVNGDEQFVDTSPLPEASARLIKKNTYAAAVLNLGAQMADALAYTHKQEICHGDVKPSNVLLTSDGKAMLFDFNLAYSHRGGPGHVGGTLPYMAPEQLRAIAGSDEEIQVDARTDIFSLGVTLYELLTGELPFGPMPADPLASRRRVAAELLERCADGPQPLRELNPMVNATAAKIVESCLAFEPAMRPASAAQLAESLRLAIADVRLGKPRAAVSLMRRRLAIALLLAACLAAFGFYVATRQPEPPPSVDHFAAGVVAYDEARYQDAATHFSNVLERQPNNFEALVGRAKAYFASGKYAAARADLQHAAVQRPADPSVGNLLTECEWQLALDSCNKNRYTEAEDYVSPILDRHPDDVEARFLRACASMRSGQFEQALADFKMCCDQSPDDGKSFAGHAYCQAMLGEQRNLAYMYHDAIEFYELATKNGLSNNASVLNGLGYCYEKLNDNVSAVKYYEKSILADSRFGTAHYNLALHDRRLATNKGGVPNANFIDRAIQFCPAAADLHLEAACIYALAASNASQNESKTKRGYLDQALRHCETAIDLGSSPNQLKCVPDFLQEISNEPRFQSLMAQPPTTTTPAKTPRLTDPLLDHDHPAHIKVHSG